MTALGVLPGVVLPAAHNIAVGSWTATASEVYDRERDCLQGWRNLSEDQRKAIVRTVAGEMERLAATVEGWLPAAARKNGPFFDILIRLSIDEIGTVDAESLTVDERLEELLVVADLEKLVESLEAEE